jgi:hypothetical protein
MSGAGRRPAAASFGAGRPEGPARGDVCVDVMRVCVSPAVATVAPVPGRPGVARVGLCSRRGADAVIAALEEAGFVVDPPSVRHVDTGPEPTLTVARPGQGEGHVVECEACGDLLVAGAVFCGVDAAVQAAGAHDDRFHGGRTTAALSERNSGSGKSRASRTALALIAALYAATFEPKGSAVAVHIAADDPRRED